MLFPYNRILFVNEKKQTTDTCKDINEHWKYNAKGKKSVTKDHIMHDFIYMKCPNWQVCRNRKPISGYLKLALEGRGVGRCGGAGGYLPISGEF